jgi:hypothetical protein
MAETGDLKSFQCRFESDRGYHGSLWVSNAETDAELTGSESRRTGAAPTIVPGF